MRVPFFRKSIIIKVLLILSDVLSLVCSLVLAVLIFGLIRPHEEVSVRFMSLGFAKLLGLLIIFMFWYQEQYSKRRPVWEELRQIYSTIFIFAVIHFGITYLLSHHIIKLFNLIFWSSLLVVLPVMRYVAKRLMLKFRVWQRDVYIIASGANALVAYNLLGANRKNNILGYRIVALVSIDNSLTGELGLPILSYVEFLHLSNEISGKYSDIEIICALPTEDLLKNIHKINELQMKYQFISIIPDIRGIPLYGVELNYFFGSDQLLLRLQNNLARRVNRIIKRFTDIVLSALLLLFLFPVFLCFILLIMWTTGGRAVFFKHKRIGRFGVPFNCIKFQTMYLNSAELLDAYLASNQEAKLEWDSSFKLRNDPRVTKIGAFLRKTSLDELPQLWNVLIGEMSLVGPRPIIEAETLLYFEDYYYYKLVRPGITGLWQVSGRSNVDYANRVRLDVWYVKNWSLWYDSVILLKTIVVVLSGKGAY